MVALAMSFAARADDAERWQPTEDIASAAESYLLKRQGNGAAGASARAGMLDRRLRLSRCDAPLEAFLRDGTRIGPRTTVGVRCSGSKPWKVYVPVVLSIRREVWIARHPLPRGHVLTADDLMSDLRDISRINAAWVSDKAALIGQRLKTSILAGRIVTRQLIEAENVVRRGQTVTLAVSSGGLTIRMTGKALTDGALNQRIRVQNLNSGRVVEGIVRSRELVEILVPSSRNIFPKGP
jgi:flagella basal body P-ring formation protein FlgA